MRKAELERATKETVISVSMNLDGRGNADIETGIGFFDHMLEAFAVHSGIDLVVKAAGDLRVDGHHTVEDTGIVMGKAFAEALGDKKGITRYGTAYIPMDESLAFVALDCSARPYLVFDADFDAYRVGELETQLVVEFFRAFAYNAGITLHAKVLYGSNDHHKIEALFKALAHALKDAVKYTGSEETLSSKGVL